MSGQGLVTAAVNNVSGTTQNPSNQTDCLARRSDHLVFTVVYSVLFLVGLILNSFILWCHCCQPLRNSSKSLMIYLKNLTVADFLLCLSLPLRIMENATSSAAAHLLYCSFGASMLFLNMYEKVVHPFGNCFLLSAGTACIISTATWVFLLVPVTTYIIMLLNASRQQWSADCSCEDVHSDLVRQIYRAIHVSAFTTFLLVLISMIFSYYRTSRKLLHADQRQSSSFSSKKLLRSRKKMLVLVCVFCVSFAPYHLVRLPLMFYQEAVFVKLFYYPLQLTTIMSVLNVCLDPLVYFFFCKDFRVQVKLRLRGFRVTHQRVNEARTGGEAQLRNMDINNEVSFSTTSRSTCEL
ncbi:P2Y purinoceptor 14-like isoform 2-T2 [Fundulus diaphanus]